MTSENVEDNNRRKLLKSVGAIAAGYPLLAQAEPVSAHGGNKKFPDSVKDELSTARWSQFTLGSIDIETGSGAGETYSSNPPWYLGWSWKPMFTTSYVAKAYYNANEEEFQKEAGGELESRYRTIFSQATGQSPAFEKTGKISRVVESDSESGYKTKPLPASKNHDQTALMFATNPVQTPFGGGYWAGLFVQHPEKGSRSAFGITYFVKTGLLTPNTTPFDVGETFLNDWLKMIEGE